MQSKYYAKEYLEIGIIAVADLHGAKSVTNDAESVVENIGKTFGNLNKWRILYRDTEGCWDELTHDGEVFTGFKSFRHERTRTLVEALEALGLPGHYGNDFDEAD